MPSLFATKYLHLCKLKPLAARFSKFGSVGLLGFLVDASIYFSLQYLGVSHLTSRFASFWVATTNNWFFNRIFTFRDAEKERKRKQWLKYCLMALGSFMINWGSYYLMTTYIAFFQQHLQFAYILGIGVAVIYNFTCSNMFIFKRTHQTSRDTPPS